MRDAISDPTAGKRARDIRDFPAGLRRRVDPTDPRYRRARLEGGQAMPNRDPTDPTYGPDVDDRAPDVEDRALHLGDRAAEVDDRPGRTGRRRRRHRRHAAQTNEDPMEPHPASSGRVDMRVLVRRSGRRVGTSLPIVISARPIGHVHGLALGEGSTEHMKVAGSPVGQVFGRRRDERLRGSRTGRGYVLRLRGLRSA